MHSSDSGYNLPPFPAFPSIERFVGLGSVQDAVDRIERSIQARDAISVVIGPPGTGKTLISELLASRHRSSHRVICLGETQLTDSDAFLRRFLHQAGADLTNIPGGDLQLALFDHLCLSESPKQRLLLLIDEAQSLSPELLETIRTLTNLTRDGEPRVSVVMFGGNHLDELLIAPSMDGFRQRISTRCYLHPLNHEETSWYITQTIRNCGCDPDATITADAISAVHHACSGVPRLINQLLSHAIEFAADKDEYLLTDQIIDQSWAEVQQLPGPMIDEPQIQFSTTAVEFGELDDFDAAFDETNVAEETSSQQVAAEPYKSDKASQEADTDYDVYDFEPDPELATASGPVDLGTSDLFPDFDDSQSCEINVDGCDATNETHDQQHVSGAPQNVAANANAEPQDDQRQAGNNHAEHLQYPTLASPALEHADELTDLDSGDATSDVIPSTISADELFGHFDEEEKIDLRNVTPITQGETADPAEKIDERPAASVETILPQEIVIHQEVVGISDLVNLSETDSIQYSDDAHQMPGKMHHEQSDASSHDISFQTEQDQLDARSHESVTSNSVFDQTGTDIRFQVTGETEAPTETRPEPIEQELTEAEQPSSKIRLQNDDSDMLIIEDEVDIHRIDQRQRTAEHRHVSIDYQRMLNRMRSKE